jgi:putative ABC transport system permease protein
MVLINVAYFDEARQSGRGKTGWYIVRIADSTQARGISSSIDNLFMNSPDETKTQPEKEFAIGFAKQIGDIGALVTRILIAVFFTILILTGYTMSQAVRERIPELAVLKCLGFTDRTVLFLVLAEALLMCSLGAGIGMVLATLAPYGFPPEFPVRTKGDVWLLSAGVVLVLSLAVGLPPAMRAMRLKIVDALAGR